MDKKRKLNKSQKSSKAIKRYFSSNNTASNEITEFDILCIKIEESEEYSYYKDSTVLNNETISDCIHDVLVEFRDKWPNNTDIHCWNCAHSFTCTPIGIPIRFDKATKTFNLNGIFCGFPCMLRYCHDMNFYNKYKLHIIHLYMVLTSKKFDTMLPAPSKTVLKMFGGFLNIEEYREIHNVKIFEYVSYPMSISRDYIEEIDLNNLKNANNYVFKNTKNNTIQKKSILDFLN
jgi:hypothetical protein